MNTKRFSAESKLAQKRDGGAASEADADVSRVFVNIAASFQGQRDVTVPEQTRRAFGSNAIKVKGKIFAMLSQGTVVVKLPADRVISLVTARRGAPFVAGGGRVMKEWLALRKPMKDWPALVREAYTFVRSSVSK